MGCVCVCAHACVRGCVCVCVRVPGRGPALGRSGPQALGEAGTPCTCPPGPARLVTPEGIKAHPGAVGPAGPWLRGLSIRPGWRLGGGSGQQRGSAPFPAPRTEARPGPRGSAPPRAPPGTATFPLGTAPVWVTGSGAASPTLPEPGAPPAEQTPPPPARRAERSGAQGR